MTDAHSWGTYVEAIAAFERGKYAGLAFVFMHHDPFADIDLDEADDDLETHATQLRIFNDFASYSE